MIADISVFLVFQEKHRSSFKPISVITIYWSKPVSYIIIINHNFLIEATAFSELYMKIAILLYLVIDLVYRLCKHNH